MDLIERQAAIDAIVNCTNCGDEKTLRAYVQKHNLDNGWTGGILEAIDAIEDLPSAQSERLTDDDFETIRIHLSAHKERLCNQHRWEEAEEYQRIIDRFMRFASAQPEPQWIPVSERLPGAEYPVIVTWMNNDPASYYQYILGKHYTGVAHYKNSKWYWYSSVTEDVLMEYGKCDSEEFDEAIEVIAWMPLPEPWKGEQE